MRRLTEFLDLNPDLLEAAAELSTDAEAEASTGELQSWIISLPQREKDVVLFQAASGKDPRAITDLARRFRMESAKTASTPSEDSRTAGELLAAADRRKEEKDRRDTERLQLEQERQEKEKAAERTKYLDTLEQREDMSWVQLDRLVATKRPNDYDRAVTLLMDLRDVALRRGRQTAFQERCRELRARHTSKPAFLRRLAGAGLDAW